MSAMTLLGALDALTGAALLGVGGLVWQRRRSRRAGGLLVLAGACWYAGALVPALVVLHRGPLVHLLATYPVGRARHPATRLAVVLGWLLAVAGGTVGGPWPILATSGLLGAIATMRATRAANRAQPVLTPVVIAGLSYATVLVVAGASLLADLDADLAVALTYDVVVALVALTLGVDLLHAPPTDDAVADVLTGLRTARGDVPGLEAQLRRVLDDPGLTIGYWAPDQGQYVDGQGQEVRAAGHRATTRVMDDGRLVAVLFHDPASLHDPGLREGATAAVRLTAANAAMRREAIQRVARLTEARRRIVEAADVEAAALAQRLEEGPQSRLREVARAVAGLDTGGSPDSATAAAVRRELDAAHHELQDLAHGVRPRDLTDGGLAMAIPSLATGSAVATHVSVEVGRLDPAVEAGLYFFCAEALANAAKHASASSVRVTVRPEPGVVAAEVVDDGVGGADPKGSGLEGLKDRIEALGGTLEVAPATPRGVRLLARVPREVGSHR